MKRIIAIALLAIATTSLTKAQSVSTGPNIIIIFTDDHGWADLGAIGVRDDIKTPHTDRLARMGTLFTSGYVTAPQCRPSRAGLMSGRYQNRFGLEHNGNNGYPWSEYTISERLRDAGYVTGHSGKWHLHGNVDSTGKLPDGSDASPEVIKAGINNRLGLQDPGMAQHHGFTEHFTGAMNRYIATHSPDGKHLGGIVTYEDTRYRLDVQAEWSADFIRRNAAKKRPFFLYTAFYAPHVPLEAPQEYLERHSSDMPLRRRKALAMLSAIDDGVGLILEALEDEAADKNTLIFYIGDNGAPLKIHKWDQPGNGAGWNGSLNEPWTGEKGMLTEGGIRVPFIAYWHGRIPAGRIEERAVISMDAVATALVAAGLPLDDRIDGVDLLPYITGVKTGQVHDALYWRWAGQYAIRSGDWKYLKAGNREYLFDLASPNHEYENLLDQQPDIAKRLKRQLIAWSEELLEPGFDHPVGYRGNDYYDFYLDGKPAPISKAMLVE